MIALEARGLGVPAQCILLETAAQNTIDNALNCLPLLQQHAIASITLVTSDYHMPRARLLFELVLEGTGIQLSWAEVSDENTSLCWAST